MSNGGHNRKFMCVHQKANGTQVFLHFQELPLLTRCSDLLIVKCSSSVWQQIVRARSGLSFIENCWSSNLFMALTVFPFKHVCAASLRFTFFELRGILCCDSYFSFQFYPQLQVLPLWFTFTLAKERSFMIVISFHQERTLPTIVMPSTCQLALICLALVLICVLCWRQIESTVTAKSFGNQLARLWFFTLGHSSKSSHFQFESLRTGAISAASLITNN